MKHRIIPLILALTLSLSLLSVNAFAALPKGYWPYLVAYNEAVESGDEAAVLAKGDAYLAFLSKYERNEDIAHNYYNVYLWRLDHEVYEKKGDWDGAIKNTKALLEVSQYLESLGIDRADMITRCQTHLAALEPFYGFYAASYTQNKTYGSKIAAASGTYYGSPVDGCYNDGSIVSVYVELESQSAGDFGYLITPKADGKRVILINLNFKGEGTTARAIPSGTYDANLKKTLNYAASLSSPVLIRIGAEFNVWTDTVTPADFIAAYNYVASMARSLAPKAELIWSPNYSSGWGVDLAAFYPNDSLVDWVGLSLYYNYTNPGGSDLMWQEFTHSGRFADPINNAAEVVAVARAKGKPVIATEGGALEYSGVANYKAEQVAKEFRELTMAYPEFKAIVYFDKNYNGNDYTLTGGTKAGVDRAIAANPTLIVPGKTSAATFIPITQLNEKMSGTLLLGATGRTYASMNMARQFTLDGKQVSTSAYCEIDLSALTEGKHRLDVQLSDGAATKVSKVYTLVYANGSVKITEGFTAPDPNDIGVTVNGSGVIWTDAKPFIDKNSRTMVPLRAVAEALNLQVDWDGTAREAIFTDGSKTIYFPIGSSTARTADGQTVMMDTAAVIANDRTYAPIRYLAEFFGHTVDWNGTTRTVIIK